MMKIHRSMFFVHNLFKHDIQKLRPVIQAQTDTKIHPKKLLWVVFCELWTMLLDSNVHHHHDAKSINAARTMYKIPSSTSGR
jgi:hypothetical protein